MRTGDGGSSAPSSQNLFTTVRTVGGDMTSTFATTFTAASKVSERGMYGAGDGMADGSAEGCGRSCNAATSMIARALSGADLVLPC